MSELKRCPFCGSEASKEVHPEKGYLIYCEWCDNIAETSHKKNSEDAIKAWNTRYENTCQNCAYWDKVEQNYDPRQYGECSKHISATPSNLTVEDFGCNKFKEKE